MRVIWRPATQSKHRNLIIWFTCAPGLYALRSYCWSLTTTQYMAMPLSLCRFKRRRGLRFSRLNFSSATFRFAFFSTRARNGVAAQQCRIMYSVGL